MLDGFTQSFKNFKDGFFCVSMEAGHEPWYLDEAGVARFRLLSERWCVGIRWMRAVGGL